MKVFKKSLAVLLAVLMLFSVMAVTASAADDADDVVNYYVVGTAELCGVGWVVDSADNVMTLGEDGLYVKTYAGVPAGDGYQFKITQGSWDEDKNWGQDGVANGQNITFNVTEACDVKITFNAETKEIVVSGDGVVIPKELKIDYIALVGDNGGDASFLNGISWDPAAEANKMSTEDGKVFTITYKGVASGNYSFKFAANGAWADNWGSPKTEGAAENTAEYNGDNLSLAVEYALADVTITLDLTNFDYTAKAGATYKVDVVDAAGSADPTEPATPGESDPTEPATPAIVPGYYGVGSAGLFGIEDDWKTSPDPRTLLSRTADGSYCRDFTNVAAGSYSFKVIYINESGRVFWHPDLEPDSQVTVEEDGSTVRVIFVAVGKAEENVSGNREKPTAEVYAPGVVPPALEPYVEPDTTEPSTPEVTEPSTPAVTEPAPTEPKPTTPAVVKKTNNLKVTVAAVKKLTTKATKKVKGKKVTKKAVTFKKAITIKKNNGGKVSYALVQKGSNTKQLSVTKKGYITVKKGVKTGTYKIKVKVTAAATTKYKKATKTVTVKVKVK